MVVFDIVAANALKIKVCEALGLDPNRVKRIVIDLNAEISPVIVDVEMVGDSRLLEIEWPPEALKVEIDES